MYTLFQTNPLLIRVDTDSGHGAGKPTAKIVSVFCRSVGLSVCAKIVSVFCLLVGLSVCATIVMIFCRSVCLPVPKL